MLGQHCLEPRCLLAYVDGLHRHLRDVDGVDFEAFGGGEAGETLGRCALPMHVCMYAYA